MSATLDLRSEPVSKTKYPSAVSLGEVTLTYPGQSGPVAALNNITLEIGAGKFVAVVGPSGCGKSTLLHLVSGILKPTSGDVSLFGRPLQGLAESVSYVLQNDGLLAWKTVAENIGLPLKMQRRPKGEVCDRVEDWLRRMGLTGFAQSFPSQLSGGMRKRVALAQALIQHPKLVLMDEPLSALDVQTRLLIGNELLSLWDKLGNTCLLVTHDLEEAIGMADEVVVLSARPSRIKAIYPIDLPRSRDLTGIRATSSFQRLYHAIWSELQEEVLKANAQQN